MYKRIILFFLLFGITEGLSAELSKVLKDAEAKYAKFEQDIKDMTILQEIKMITDSGSITQDVTMLKKGRKFRMNMKAKISQTPDMPQGMGNLESNIIYDGNDIWMFSPFTGKKKLSGEEGGQYGMQGNWWEQISNKAEVTGTENVNDYECYVVKFKTGSGAPFTTMWLDKKKLLLVKCENKKLESQNMVWINSDFKKIKGDWEIPYKTEMYMDSKLISTSTVKSTEIDKGLSEDLFDPNKVSVKGFNTEEMINKMMQEQKQK